jgi:hypothetical protein
MAQQQGAISCLFRIVSCVIAELSSSTPDRSRAAATLHAYSALNRASGARKDGIGPHRFRLETTASIFQAL